MSDIEDREIRELSEEDEGGEHFEAGPEPQGETEAPPSQKPAPDVSAGNDLYRVKLCYSSATEFCACPAGMTCNSGDTVVVPSKHGNALGLVLGKESGPETRDPADVRVMIRKASPADLARAEENRTREQKAYAICVEKIAARGLEMKLVSAHYILDEQKILFFFTAENRIDFRELVKDLVAVFKMRIELRQIGVRDEARVLGGMGICGRVLCCNSVTDRLRPVSIKMAKEQNLTLNSMKISGPCGRLLCCLAYEFDIYREARQQLPPLGTRVRFEDEDFKVSEMNVLARRVRFQGESGRILEIGFDSLSRDEATGQWEIRLRAAPGA